MMVRAVVLGFFFVTLMSDGLHAQKMDEASILILRITSSDSTETLICAATWLFKSIENEISCGDLSTPFEISGPVDVFSGIFRKRKGKADMVVQLFQRTGLKEQLLEEAEGSVVLINKKFKEHSSLSY